MSQTGERIVASGGPVTWPSLPSSLASRIGTWTTARGLQAPAGDVYGFNLGLHVGDDRDQVLKRREELARHLQVQPVWMRQVHGVHCAEIDATPHSLEDSIEADAAICRQPDRAALVMTADCLPVLLVNAQTTAVGAVHCGWRGLLNGVLESTLRGMGRTQAVYAWLGPAIGPHSFQVGATVREAYLNKNAAFESAFIADATGAYRADLYELAKLTLQSALGPSTQLIFDCDQTDTFTHAHLNSFRRNPVTGRQASLIWLKGR